MAEGLRLYEIEASSAREEGRLGISDEEQLSHAKKLKAVLFTHDHHLIEIAEAWNKKGDDHFGVIFMEMQRLKTGECIRRLALYAEVLSPDEMKNQIEFL